MEIFLPSPICIQLKSKYPATRPDISKNLAKLAEEHKNWEESLYWWYEFLDTQTEDKHKNSCLLKIANALYKLHRTEEANQIINKLNTNKNKITPNETIKIEKSETLQKLTLVILNWDRKNMIEDLVNEYSKYQYIDDIIVWNNNKKHFLKFDDQIVKVVNTTWDLGLDTRYAACYLSKNENILLHDDDLKLTEQSVNFLFEKYLQEPDRIHSIHGRNLKNGLYNVEDCYGEVDIVLTRAQIINKKYINTFFEKSHLFSSIRKYSCGNGEDIIMNYIVRSITGKKNLSHYVLHQDQYEQNILKTAISGRKYHLETRQEITNKCIALMNDKNYFIDKNLIENLKFADYEIKFYNALGLFYNKYTNTYPYFVHAPGYNKKSTKFQQLALAASSLGTCLNDDITLITCGDSEQGMFENICSKLGIKIIKLGGDIQKQNWSNFVKIKLIHDYLDKIQTKYVLFCDNLDVLIAKNLENLINDFQSFNCEWLFGAEEGIYPLDVENYRLQQKISGKKRYEFLNSGLWIGNTEFIKKTFEEYIILQKPKPTAVNSDQYVYTKCYLEYFPKIQIDFDCKIFMNLCVKKDNSENILVQIPSVMLIGNYEDNYEYLNKYPYFIYLNNEENLTKIEKSLFDNFQVITVINDEKYLDYNQLYGANIIHISKNIDFNTMRYAISNIYKFIY
jgi:hypothetical protein